MKNGNIKLIALAGTIITIGAAGQILLNPIKALLALRDTVKLVVDPEKGNEALYNSMEYTNFMVEGMYVKTLSARERADREQIFQNRIKRQRRNYNMNDNQ